jgi:hypothetical protein
MNRNRQETTGRLSTEWVMLGRGEEKVNESQSYSLTRITLSPEKVTKTVFAGGVP